jgi:hypothetical protein
MTSSILNENRDFVVAARCHVGVVSFAERPYKAALRHTQNKMVEFGLSLVSCLAAC